ncbi:DoxX family protein [soil metagenome]
MNIRRNQGTTGAPLFGRISEAFSSSWLKGQRRAQFDERVVGLASRYGVPLLRYSLGANFIWFGALKVTNSSPVGELVADTVYWVPPKFFVPFLGWWEIAVGLGLVSGRAPRTTLLFFLMQMAGTFLVFVEKPDVAFQGRNPLLLTTEGEFVVKNLILISAGIVIASTLQRGDE